jgi:hypothetical protein
MPKRELWQRLASEALGRALLAAVVIGSGIAAQQLSPMFSQPAGSISTHQRATAAHFLSGIMATAG